MLGNKKIYGTECLNCNHRIGVHFTNGIKDECTGYVREDQPNYDGKPCNCTIYIDPRDPKIKFVVAKTIKEEIEIIHKQREDEALEVRSAINKDFDLGFKMALQETEERLQKRLNDVQKQGEVSNGA